MNATLNDLYPGTTPAGTRVEVLSINRHSALIRIGRKTVKASPRWLDFEEVRFRPRAVRVTRSVVG